MFYPEKGKNYVTIRNNQRDYAGEIRRKRIARNILVFCVIAVVLGVIIWFYNKELMELAEKMLERIIMSIR